MNPGRLGLKQERYPLCCRVVHVPGYIQPPRSEAEPAGADHPQVQEADAAAGL